MIKIRKTSKLHIATIYQKRYSIFLNQKQLYKNLNDMFYGYGIMFKFKNMIDIHTNISQ